MCKRTCADPFGKLCGRQFCEAGCECEPGYLYNNYHNCVFATSCRNFRIFA